MDLGGLNGMGKNLPVPRLGESGIVKPKKVKTTSLGHGSHEYYSHYISNTDSFGFITIFF